MSTAHVQVALGAVAESKGVTYWADPAGTDDGTREKSRDWRKKNHLGCLAMILDASLLLAYDKQVVD